MLSNAIQKKKRRYLLWGLVCIALSSGCSTGRNSSSTRAYHELTTRYNVYFNAVQAYHDIQKERTASFQEDYSELLPFYPSHPNAEKSPSGGPFDPVIAKTEKAIREHSITAKPRRDPAKAQSQEYRQWLKQEEFNPFMKKVWILRGKAYLQNGNYDEALSIFSGMLRLFSHDPEMVDETEIWMLRAYTEMGRNYEAEKTAYTLRNKKLSPYLERLFTEHYTYLLIRKEEFAEATPYLQKVIAQEPDHPRKKRLQFLLGQIYAITGENNNAQFAFEKVKGLRTPSDLIQHAAIWQSAVTNDSLSKIFRPVTPDKDTTLWAALTDSITGENQLNTKVPQRLSQGRTLAENAALHRQWRSRNGSWQNQPTLSPDNENGEGSRFTVDKSGPHYLLLTPVSGPVDKDRLLFATANFNFSHFKLRRFNTFYTYVAGREVLQVEPFRSFDEASQYAERMLSDSLFRSGFMNITPIIISKANLQLVTFPPAITKEDTVEIDKKNSQEPEKIVSLKTTVERETPEALKRRLEENASNAVQQQEKGSRINRQQSLKEREKQRKEKIRQRERELKERERKREAELKQRERERESKIRRQQ